MYLDFAELQAERQNPMKMSDQVTRLESFLEFNDYKVLKDGGKISANIAKQLAEQENSEFRTKQDREFESDFVKEVKRIIKKSKGEK